MIKCDIGTPEADPAPCLRPGCDDRDVVRPPATRAEGGRAESQRRIGRGGGAEDGALVVLQDGEPVSYIGCVNLHSVRTSSQACRAVDYDGHLGGFEGSRVVCRGWTEGT